MPLQETELSKALLNIEACILTENNDHAVIAFRVDKAVIARNLHFLAALADLRCTCTDRCPAR